MSFVFREGSKYGNEHKGSVLLLQKMRRAGEWRCANKVFSRY